MRFCIVTPFFPSSKKSAGGVGTHYFDLAVSLAPHCEKIFLLHVSGDSMDKQVRAILPENVEVREIGTHGSLKHKNPYSIITKIKKRIAQLALNIRVAYEIQRLDREQKLDVVETTNYYYLCLCYSFWPNHKPLITRVSSTTSQLRQYGEWIPSRLNLIERLENWMFKRSSIKITHTRVHGKIIADEVNISPREIKIIPHGTLTKGRPPRNSSPKNNLKLVVLFLGRLESRKGIQTLLAAVPKLARDHDNICFRIAGEDINWHFKNEFSEQFPEWVDKVKFLGEISDQQKLEEYSDCDIFVAPSLYESFGLIYIEAMSFAKPVIGCNTGGTPEVVKDGETGFLISPESVSELTTAISTLVSDATKRERMGRSGQNRVYKHFTAEIMASKTIKLLRTVKRDWRYQT